MAETPNRLVVDCATGEQTTVPLTAEEIAEREEAAKLWAEQEEKNKAEAQAKAEAKASALAKLEALGLSEEEAKAIAG